MSASGVRPKATWGDVTRRGQVVVAYREPVVTADEVTVPAPPEPLLFVRADEGPHGLVVVGQGHQTGRGWAWVQHSGLGWQDLGGTHGAFCVETDGERIWKQHAPTQCVIHHVATMQRDVRAYPGHPEGTSQGFLDCTDPELLWTDLGRVREGLVLPQRCGPYLVGQHPDADAILLHRARERRVVLRRPGLFEPRAAWVDDRAVVLVRAAEGVVVVRARPQDLDGWTWAPSPPSPSRPETTPMSYPDLLPLLRQTRARYGATMTDDECVDLLNRVAWAARTEGLGLSRKTTGTRGRRHDGVECCHDVVMLPDGTYWDVLEAAGAESRPVWGPPAGRITDPARGWVAPIEPPPDVVTPTPPTPTYPPPPVPAPPLLAETREAATAAVAPLLAEVRALREEVRAVREALRHVAELVAAQTPGVPAEHAQEGVERLMAAIVQPRPVTLRGRVLGTVVTLTGRVDAP